MSEDGMFIAELSSSQLDASIAYITDIAKKMRPRVSRTDARVSLETAFSCGKMCTSAQLTSMFSTCGRLMQKTLETLNGDQELLQKPVYDYMDLVMWFVVATMPVQRREVIAELNIEDLSLEASSRCYHLTRTSDKNERYQGSPRLVVIAQEATQYLSSWLTDMRPRVATDECSRVFVSRQGDNIAAETVSRRIQKVSARLCGQSWSPVDLRHIRCTLYYYTVQCDERLTFDQKMSKLNEFSRFVSHDLDTFLKYYVYKSAEADIQAGSDFVREANDYLKSTSIVDTVFDRTQLSAEECNSLDDDAAGALLELVVRLERGDDDEEVSVRDDRLPEPPDVVVPCDLE